MYVKNKKYRNLVSISRLTGKCAAQKNNLVYGQLIFLQLRVLKGNFLQIYDHFLHFFTHFKSSSSTTSGVAASFRGF